MKLAMIETNGLAQPAVIVGGYAKLLSPYLAQAAPDLTAVLELGEPGRRAARAASDSVGGLPLSAVRLLAPISRADKVVGIGLNFHSFVGAARDIGLGVPAERFWFLRPPSCLTGPGDNILTPKESVGLDYEGELAVIIGAACRGVSKGEAAGYIAGYSVANDVTLRPLAARSIVLGKAFPSHTPIGPWIVTSDEIGDPQALRLRTWVNDELRQDDSTSDMILGIHELIAELSQACTLLPGDVILTGTPDGSGIFQTPPSALSPGDVVRIEIENIGVIENQVAYDAVG